jgi:outer membrane protein TolC
MTMKLLVPVTALSLFLVPAMLGSPAPRTLDEGFLSELRAEVRRNHPSALAAQQRWEAAGASTRSVRLWDDPTVGFSALAADHDRRRDDGDLGFAVEQTLPRRRLYDALRDQAAAEQRARRAQLRGIEMNLEAELGQTALELALADESLSIQERQLGWIRTMTTQARDRLQDPTASAASPLRLESELAQEKQRLVAAISERMELARRLNLLLGRAVEQPWEKLALPTNALTIATPDLAFARLIESNPDLESLRETANAAGAEAKAMRRERRPNFGVGAETRLYSGGAFRETLVTLRMNLPWFNGGTYRAREEQALHEHAAAKEDLQARQRTLSSAAVRLYTEAQNAAQQANVYGQEIVPRAEKAAEAVDNAWVSNKGTLLEVLDARRSLLLVQLEQRRSVARYLAALESLRALVPPASPP